MPPTQSARRLTEISDFGFRISDFALTHFRTILNGVGGSLTARLKATTVAMGYEGAA